jgi:hypothetical protein
MAATEEERAKQAGRRRVLQHFKLGSCTAVNDAGRSRCSCAKTHTCRDVADEAPRRGRAPWAQATLAVCPPPSRSANHG